MDANPATYTIESAAITLDDPTRDGFDFAGWYENSGFTGSEVTLIPAGSMGHKTFYAQWWPKVLVDVSVWVNEDGKILTSNNDITISKSASGNPASFTATVTGAYSGIQWNLNGGPQYGTAQSVTIKAADYPNGSYHLGGTVTKDGVPYSTNIHFKVVN